MTEQWRAIPGWEGFYAVSDQGRVRSLTRKVASRPGVIITWRGRVLKLTPNQDGYPTVGLRRNGTRTSLRVAPLVLFAFIGPRPDGYEACHIDGTRDNSRLGNLRWGTRSSNILDTVHHGTHPQSSKTHCPAGHEYTEANTYLSPDGDRHCRTCLRANRRAYNERKRAAS